jgi:hypothetical protein
MTTAAPACFIVGMGETEYELFDDYEFEPTAWDLALEIGLGPDPETDRPALDELADAMLVWAKGPELDRLTDDAIDRLWSAELASEIRDGLGRVAAQGEEWAAAATAARLEFERTQQRSPLARAVTQHLAMWLGDLDVPFLFCPCCIDLAVAHADRPARRRLALQAAILARRNAEVGDDEVQAALTRTGSQSPVERLATEGRRTAVRRRLGRVGRLGRDSIPALATELRALAAEPLPERAVDDDVWGAVCTALLAEVARPDLN